MNQDNNHEKLAGKGNAVYEVELKVEITAEEFEKLKVAFEARGFPHTKTTPQNDFYIEAIDSPHGGHDLKRYRDEDGKIFYTEKVWEMVDGRPARREAEYEVSRDDFNSKIESFPDAVKIIKTRDWYAGENEGRKISLTVDTVKFDHSPQVRYFIEAEIDTENRSEVNQVKEMIRGFLEDLLEKSEIIEAPGMFSLAFEKR